MLILLQGNAPHEGGGGGPVDTGDSGQCIACLWINLVVSLLSLSLTLCCCVACVCRWRSSTGLPKSIRRFDKAELSLTTTASPTPSLDLRVQQTYWGDKPPNNGTVITDPFTLHIDNVTRRMEGRGKDCWGVFTLRGSFALTAATHGQFRMRKNYVNRLGCHWVMVEGWVVQKEDEAGTMYGTWEIGYPNATQTGHFRLELLDLAEGERLAIIGQDPALPLPQPPPEVEGQADGGQLLPLGADELSDVEMVVVDEGREGAAVNVAAAARMAAPPLAAPFEAAESGHRETIQ